LQKIRVVQNVGIVVRADAEIGLRSGIIALLKGIDENVDQGIDHKNADEQDGRQ
jgi:hypothetical protein